MSHNGFVPIPDILSKVQKKFPDENKEDLEVDTLDGIQGREKELVLVSLTRNNPEGNIGFLKDLKRLNVSITRARRKLIIISDSRTVCTDETYNSFYDFVSHQRIIIPIDQVKKTIDN